MKYPLEVVRSASHSRARRTTQSFSTLIAILVLTALFPIERANAVQAANCGDWFTTGGFDPYPVTDSLDDVGNGLAGYCEFDLTYSTQAPNQPVDLVFNFDEFGAGLYVFASFPYQEDQASVHNETGLSWDDYHIEFGTGDRGDFILGAGVDFQDFVQIGPFQSEIMSVFSLDFDEGVVASGGSFNYGVVLDVQAPFTLRQYYTVDQVPVPATLALFGLGLAGLGWSRRKKS